MVVMMPRETWTDARLDDLNKKVDDGFATVDKRFDRLESRMDQQFSELNQRFDRMQLALIVSAAGIIASLLGLVTTQL